MLGLQTIEIDFRMATMNQTQLTQAQAATWDATQGAYDYTQSAYYDPNTGQYYDPTTGQYIDPASYDYSAYYGPEYQQAVAATVAATTAGQRECHLFLTVKPYIQFISNH